MPDPIWPSAILMLLLLLFSALLHACETAFDAVSESNLRRQAEEGDEGARRLVALFDHPSPFLAALRLWALFTLGASAVLLCPIAGKLFSLTWQRVLFLLLLFLVYYWCGWLIPRRIAMAKPEGVLRRLCPPFRLLALISRVITAPLSWITKALLRLAGVDPDADGDDVSEDEIMALVEDGEEAGAIQSDEKEFIENVFEFNDLTAGDVMVHRTDMVMIQTTDTEEEILEEIQSSGLSRFPVYESDADDIIGILSTRDYLLNLHKKPSKPLKELLRPAYFVPESVKADALFRDMQSKAIHMSIVVDEYGGTSGLVTMEDLLEELVGNIYDEFDPREELEIVPLGENLWRIAGSAELDDVADALQVEFPEEELCDTLGGLVFSQLSVIPEDGATPEVDAYGLHIQVEKLTDHRVEWALVSLLPPEEG